MNMKAGIWYWALGGILSVSTVLGNSLVIYLIISRKRLHKTVNWFLFSLAVADLCVLYLCVTVQQVYIDSHAMVIS